MSLLDMSEFGEAAPYLRKSYTEQLKLQTIPFDGKSPALLSTAPRCPRVSLPLCQGSLRILPAPFPVLQNKASQAEFPQHLGEQNLTTEKSRFLTFPWFAEVWVEGQEG